MMPFAIPTAPIPLADDADAWARIRTLAHWLQIDRADLDDESDCWRALVIRGVPAGVARNLVGEVVAVARENQVTTEVSP